MVGFGSRRHIGGWMVAMLGCLLAGVLAGCGVTAGLNPAPDDPQSSAQFRTEMEVVPNARLVREDTMPRWQAGRFAFVRGVDNLLVLAHITSTAQWSSDKKTFVNRHDLDLERLWIALPEDVEVGKVLDAEAMESKYLIGYDSGRLGDGQFIEPWKTTGNLTVLENKPDHLAVHLNLLVSPKRRPNWAVQGVFQVEKNEQGVYAKPLPPDASAAYLNESANVGQVAVTSPGASEPAAAASAPAATEGAATEPASDGAATAPQDDSSATGPATAPARSIVGMWENVTPKWYERYQFNADGTVIHANCRPGYPPAINTGTWEIRNDKFLVVTIKHYTYDHIGAYSPDTSLLTEPYVGLLRMTWQDDGRLRLTGKVWRRGKEPLDMIFSPANFPDMAIIPPPHTW